MENKNKENGYDKKSYKTGLYKIRMVIRREWKDALAAALCAAALTGYIAVCSYAGRVSERIEDSVVRFHVLANSDSETDQRLKLRVRDEVLEYLRPEMEKCESRREAEDVLISKTEGITETAERVIKEAGLEYDVKTELSRERYPVRYYADAVFPEGEYSSLRIVIGEGKGHNWWCVMYPPLCLGGESIGEDDRETLRDALGDEGYEVVMLSSEDAVPKMKFKIVEWFEKIKE